VNDYAGRLRLKLAVNLENVAKGANGGRFAGVPFAAVMGLGRTALADRFAGKPAPSSC